MHLWMFVVTLVGLLFRWENTKGSSNCFYSDMCWDAHIESELKTKLNAAWFFCQQDFTKFSNSLRNLESVCWEKRYTKAIFMGSGVVSIFITRLWILVFARTMEEQRDLLTYIASPPPRWPGLCLTYGIRSIISYRSISSSYFNYVSHGQFLLGFWGQLSIRHISWSKFFLRDRISFKSRNLVMRIGSDVLVRYSNKNAVSTISNISVSEFMDLCCQTW